MATEKKFSGILVPRHDTALNWSKAINFVPKMGELVVYEIDTTTYNGSGTAINKNGTTASFTYESSTKTRFKFGDGLHNINLLPFAESNNEIVDDVTSIPYRIGIEDGMMYIEED